MSNFQLALVITFGVILVLYVGFNTWSARRNEPKKPRPEEAGGTSSVSEDEARFEPGFDGKVGGATGDPVRHGEWQRLHAGKCQMAGQRENANCLNCNANNSHYKHE